MNFVSFIERGFPSAHQCCRHVHNPITPSTARLYNTSPYGRTHVWKNRPPTLPKPFVPQFPQRVVRADGSSFVHYTSSPRSVIRLTRDTTNHPLWNVSRLSGDSLEEDKVTGRLGRFNRRFDGIGGHGQDVDWMGEVTASVEGSQSVVQTPSKGNEEREKTVAASSNTDKK